MTPATSTQQRITSWSVFFFLQYRTTLRRRANAIHLARTRAQFELSCLCRTTRLRSTRHFHAGRKNRETLELCAEDHAFFFHSLSLSPETKSRCSISDRQRLNDSTRVNCFSDSLLIGRCYRVRFNADIHSQTTLSLE